MDNLPFITGLSADNADVPKCETWSNNEKMQYIDCNEAYPFIDEEADITEFLIYIQEKPEHFSSNTNELVRDCDNCTHYATVKGKTGCESWECKFEKR